MARDLDAIAAETSLATAYSVLFKPRVSVMVIITAAVGLYLGDLRSGVNPLHLQALFALAGVALVTCGSSVLNQVLERKSDALMPRTRSRPMVTGRIGLLHGLLLGFAAVVGGTLVLATKTNVLTTTLTLLTAIAYVAIYTPLKRITSLNTFIGAFPGALPPLIGWTAARGVIEWPGVALFAVLFVWQFPHFMAIAWMYREDYARAGIRMLPVVDPSGDVTFRVIISMSAVLVPVSLLPAVMGMAGIRYFFGALILGMLLLQVALWANRARTNVRAKWLMHATVAHIPLLLGWMIFDKLGR